MEDSNPNIDLINTFTKFGEILSICPQDIEQKQILMPYRGHNFVTYLWKTTGKNPIDTDLVNINAFIKFGQILSICSKDTERKRNSDMNQGS